MGEPSGGAGFQVVDGPVTNNEVSEWSMPFAAAVSVTSPRPDGVTGYTGCTVEIALLCNAFFEDLWSTVLLNHVQHEAMDHRSFKGCWIWTTLSTAKVFLLLLSRPRLCRSASVGHWRRCRMGDMHVAQCVLQAPESSPVS